MPVRKAKIVSELTGSTLLLPDLVVEGLAANARIKFALSWLQAANGPTRSRAAADGAGLEAERAIAGLADDSLYAAPEATSRGDVGVEVPRAGAVLARIRDDLGRMGAATDAAAAARLLDESAARDLRRREEVIGRAVKLDDDVIPAGLVSRLTRPPHDGHDTLHGLVMDLHKALNDIASRLSEQEVAGARGFRLSEDDKARLAAFMRGLNRTSPLKFHHPGLSTTAVRDGARLIIQNDIGMTEAHVLVATVQGLRLSVTSSDVHRRRLEFFASRLAELTWTTSTHASPKLADEAFYVATGVFDAPNVAALDGVLERLGASLVFLIDWNKARKSLSRLVPKSDAIALLGWAADHEVGHRGYLEVGGDTLVGELLATASKVTGEPYTSLRAGVGDEGAVEFLREALRTASEGLRSGRSPMAIRDVLVAELLARAASAADRILDLALDHAALVLDLGNLVRSALIEHEGAHDVAARAKAWEAKADVQVSRIRELAGRGEQRAWRVIASGVDDAADALEEAAFRIQFLPADLPADVRDGLCRLADHAAAAVSNYVRLLCALRTVHRGAAREELRRFVDLVQALHDDEHATDAAEREVFASLMRMNADARLLSIAGAIGEDLEAVGDVLLRAGRLVSDHVMGEWLES